MNRSLPVIALLVVTSLGRADDLDVAPGDHPTPSARELQWGEGLCARLGVAKAEAVVIGASWTPTPRDGALYTWLSTPYDAPPARTRVEGGVYVRGVQVQVQVLHGRSDGTLQAAIDYPAGGGGRSRSPT